MDGIIPGPVSTMVCSACTPCQSALDDQQEYPHHLRWPGWHGGFLLLTVPQPLLHLLDTTWHETLSQPSALGRGDVQRHRCRTSGLNQLRLQLHHQCTQPRACLQPMEAESAREPSEIPQSLCPFLDAGHGRGLLGVDCLQVRSSSDQKVLAISHLRLDRRSL